MTCLLPPSLRHPKGHGRTGFCILCPVLERRLAARRCSGMNSLGLEVTPTADPDVTRSSHLPLPATARRCPPRTWAGVIWVRSPLPTNFHSEPPTTGPGFSCQRLFFSVLEGYALSPPPPLAQRARLHFLTRVQNHESWSPTPCRWTLSRSRPRFSFLRQSHDSLKEEKKTAPCILLFSCQAFRLTEDTF